MKRFLFTASFIVFSIASRAVVGPITGPMSVCAGSTVALNDTSAGGVWSSSDVSIATVGSASGIVTGVAGGIATITYTASAGFVVADVTVNPQPVPYVVGLVPGSSSSYCIGSPSTANIRLSSSATGVNYDLLLAGTPTGISTAGTGAPIDFGVQTAPGTYTVRGTDASTTCSYGMISSVTVAANPLPAVYTVTGGGSFCSGGTGVGIGLSGSQAGVNYQLRIGFTTILAIGGTGSPISFGLQNTPGIYNVVAINTSTGCSQIMTGSATVVVDPLPNIYPIIGGGSYCTGGSGVSIGLGGSDGGISYQLLIGGIPTGANVPGYGLAFDFGFTTVPGIYTVLATNNSTGCTSNMSGSAVIVVNPIPIISGSSAVCPGATITLTVGGGGAWSSSLPSVATVVSTTGVVTGVAMGTTIITYTAPTGCYNTKTVTVSTGPGFIAGPGSICVGTATALTNATPGGVWSSGSTGVATVGSLTGIVTGVSAGTTTIYYSLGTMCVVSCITTVNPSPSMYTVTGGGSYCSGGPGTHIGLSGSEVGKNYQLLLSADNVSWFPIGGGSRTGTGAPLDFGAFYSPGFFKIRAMDPVGGCSRYMLNIETVIINLPPGIITGPSTVCITNTVTLIDSTPGGTWTSSNPTVAPIDPVSGIVTGVALGSAIISYSLGTGCARSITLNVTPGVCTITPVGGAANPSAPTTCTGIGENIVLTGASSGCGIVYQWQSSPDGFSFTDIAGATSSHYFYYPTVTQYLRCKVICSSSGIFDYSSMTSVTVHSTIASHGIVSSIDTVCNNVDFYVSACGLSSSFNVTTWFGDGTSVNTPLSTTGICNAHIYHSYDLPGTYLVKQVLYIGTVAQDTVNFSHEYLYCRTLPVKYYFDANNNCAFDAGDKNILLPIKMEIDSNGIAIDSVSATSGFYYKALGGIGTVYTFKVIGTPAGFHVTCPSTGVLYDTIRAAVNNYHPKYFGLNCVSGTSFDLVQHVTTQTGRHRQDGIVMVNNTFCAPEDADVTLHFDPRYQYHQSSPPATAHTDSTATWHLTAISSSTTTYPVISYWLEVPGPYSTWLVNGEPIRSTYLTMGTATGDLDTSNNILIKNDTVRSSYDPNEISVSPEGYVLPCTQLQYTIKFENDGNDTAHNIYVMDTLSDDLDLHSLNIEIASSAMNIAITRDGTHHVVKFDFPNIMLPDSSHHNQCSGMVIFNIKTKPGTPDGTIIPNRAGIFFDDNPAVLTNTIQNTTGIPPLAGPDAVCTGSGISLTNIKPGGTWTSTAPAIATVGSTGGVLGVAAGTTTISYALSNSCTSRYAIKAFTVNPNPAPITGMPMVCSGATTPLSDTGSGTWTSSNTAVATVGVSGIVTGVSADTATITYSFSTGCTVTKRITVNPTPVAIAGPGPACTGIVTTLTNATPSGTWHSSNTVVAAIGSATGVTTGVSAGTAMISYVLSNGCMATTGVTINTSPAPIAGTPVLCNGTTTTLTDGGGGVWASSNTAVAVIGSTTGVVSGISADTATIIYTLAGGCTATRAITVNPTPSPISGTTTLCSGNTTMLTDTTAGGIWHSSSTSIAGIGSATGIISGVASGAATISYTLPAGCMATTFVTVNPLPTIFSITGGGPYCSGDTGVHIGLAGSVTGTNYFLHHGASVTGSFAGTGSGIDFGLQTVPGAYRVSATNTATTCQRALPDSTVVSVTPTMVPSVTMSAVPGTTVCSGTAVLFTPAAINGGTAPVYVWTVNGSNVGTGSTYIFAPAHGDHVKVTLNSSADCATPDTTSTSETMTVLDAGPIAVSIGSSPGLFIEVGQPDTFTATTTGGGTYVYQWYINGNPVPGATNSTFICSTLFTGDAVTCNMNNSGPCPQSGTSSVTITLNNVGIPGFSMGGNILLSPNPNNGVFTVKGSLMSHIDGEVNIEIMNMLGQTVYKGMTMARYGVIDEQISLGDGLPGGVYVLSVQSGSERGVYRFVMGK